MEKSGVRGRGEVRSKGQITIPASVRAAARISEGDLVEMEVTAEGVLMRPLKTIDAQQAWFWDSTWQAGEQEASQDLAASRTTRHKSGKALLRALKK